MNEVIGTTSSPSSRGIACRADVPPERVAAVGRIAGVRGEQDSRQRKCLAGAQVQPDAPQARLQPHRVPAADIRLRVVAHVDVPGPGPLDADRNTTAGPSQQRKWEVLGRTAAVDAAAHGDRRISRVAYRVEQLPADGFEVDWREGAGRHAAAPGPQLRRAPAGVGAQEQLQRRAAGDAGDGVRAGVADRAGDLDRS
ncbi:hypothetical protein ACVMIH_007522 [Bradyrhizobium sp. USDA 4503]